MGRKKKVEAPKVAPQQPYQHPLARCRPRGDRVVVKRDVAKKQSAGGIFLPDSFSNNKQQTGTVHSVGPGRYDAEGNLVPINLCAGDRVIITGYAGLEIADPIGSSGSETEEYIIIREEDILATLN